MALIKCPECGKEISNTADQCVNCGYVLKKKKNITSYFKILIPIICAIAIAIICLFISKKMKYPELMELLQKEYVVDAVAMLGKDYEFMPSSTVNFYIYKNYELDGVVYDEIYIRELESDGRLSQIGVDFLTEDLENVNSYIKDICKIYGNYEETSYSSVRRIHWTTANRLNPEITFDHGDCPYYISITVD